MAVFEKKIPRKVYLDDTQTLTCEIENARNLQGHTEYVIRVQRGPSSDKCWHIYKRYNDFVSLHNVLQISGLNLPLPPKKLIGNMEREFIAERQIGLQNYINIVLMNPILASSLPVRKFLDPENYAAPFHEVALQHVSMALRSEINYEIVKPVPEMGWRLRKHYFQIKGRNNPKELLLSWVEHGPDKYLDDRELHAVFKSIGTIQHPNIQNVEFLNCNEVGGFVIRPLHVTGSLRDALCLAKPKVQFIKKYGNPKQVKPLPSSDIACYGKQILEVLKFLHEKGLPFGHLQTGNIILENGIAKILDIENGVLGLPSYYRPFFVQHKKIQTLESVDVYCFGHVLYEMAFGHPLHESVCDMFPASCCPSLRSILESILSSEACKTGLPLVSSLLAHQFFNVTSPSGPLSTSSERPHLKFSASVKEALKLAWLKTEIRLKEEQKMVRHQKRLARVQEMLSSEEERRKRQRARPLDYPKLLHGPPKPQETQPTQQPQVHHLQKSQQPLLVANGKSPERSESPNSTSTATSAGTVTPPCGLIESNQSQVQSMIPSTVGDQPTLSSPVSVTNVTSERSALLDSICNFNKASLRNANTKEMMKTTGRISP